MDLWQYHGEGIGRIQGDKGDSDEVSNVHKSVNKNVETEYFLKLIFLLFFLWLGAEF
jgi:hypothetical protein